MAAAEEYKKAPQFAGIAMGKARAARRFNEKQKVMIAAAITHFLGRRLFSFVIQPDVDRFMAMLLMKVYLSAVSGKPLHKKAAWREMGVEDIKTGRKYIAVAEEKGLLKVAQSAQDRRMELLYPTEKLHKHIDWEVEEFARMVRRLLYDLLEFPLADHCGPYLRRGIRSSQFPDFKYAPLPLEAVYEAILRMWSEDLDQIWLTDPEDPLEVVKKSESRRKAGGS